jgi:hypothetical protein
MGPILSALGHDETLTAPFFQLGKANPITSTLSHHFFPCPPPSFHVRQAQSADTMAIATHLRATEQKTTMVTAYRKKKSGSLSKWYEAQSVRIRNPNITIFEVEVLRHPALKMRTKKG